MPYPIRSEVEYEGKKYRLKENADRTDNSCKGCVWHGKGFPCAAKYTKTHDAPFVACLFYMNVTWEEIK